MSFLEFSIPPLSEETFEINSFMNSTFPRINTSVKCILFLKGDKLKVFQDKEDGCVCKRGPVQMMTKEQLKLYKIKFRFTKNFLIMFNLPEVNPKSTQDINTYMRSVG